MTNWTVLNNAIRQVIYSNGTRDITGQILQTALLNIVNNVGSLPAFGGTATPSTNPGVHDGPVFYIATAEGTYSNFNNIAIAKAELPSILICTDGTWAKQVIGTAIAADVEALVASLGTETSRAMAAESALQSSISAEASRAQAKEAELQDAVAGIDSIYGYRKLNPVSKRTDVQLSTSGTIQIASGQVQSVTIYDISNLVGKKIKIEGGKTGPRVLYSVSTNGTFDSSDTILLASDTSILTSDYLYVQSGYNYIAVNSATLGVFATVSEPYPIAEEINEDINSVVSDVYLQSQSHLTEKRIDTSGHIVNATAQEISVSVFDISDRVGDTLTISGEIKNYNDRLYAISENGTFDSEDEILLVANKINASTITAMSDTIKVLANYNYLAVMVYSNAEEGMVSSAGSLADTFNDVRDGIQDVRGDVQDVRELVESAISIPTYDILFWGDSLTVGNQDGEGTRYPDVVASILGTSNYKNCGIGGEMVNDITFRQGANNLVIPKGPINGTYARSELKDLLGIGPGALLNQNDIGDTVNPISINQHEATISHSYTGGVHYYTISGYDGGNSDHPLLAKSKASEWTCKIAVICIGTNGSRMDENYYGTGNQADFLAMAVDTMVSRLGHDRFIVLSPSSHTPAPADIDGATERSKYDSLEKSLSKYGNRFVHFRRELVEHGLEINGLTPTADDAKAIAKGYIPYTLLNSTRGDYLHLSHYGYYALGVIVAERCKALGFDKVISNT